MRPNDTDVATFFRGNDNLKEVFASLLFRSAALGTGEGRGISLDVIRDGAPGAIMPRQAAESFESTPLGRASARPRMPAPGQPGRVGFWAMNAVSMNSHAFMHIAKKATEATAWIRSSIDEAGELLRSHMAPTAPAEILGALKEIIGQQDEILSMASTENGNFYFHAEPGRPLKIATKAQYEEKLRDSMRAGLSITVLSLNDVESLNRVRLDIRKYDGHNKISSQASTLFILDRSEAIRQAREINRQASAKKAGTLSGPVMNVMDRITREREASRDPEEDQEPGLFGPGQAPA